MFWRPTDADKVIDALYELKKKRAVVAVARKDEMCVGFAAQVSELIQIATGKDSEQSKAFKSFISNREDFNPQDSEIRVIGYHITNKPIYFNSIIDGCIEQVESVGLPRIPQESKNLLGTLDNAAMLTLLSFLVLVSFWAGSGVFEALKDNPTPSSVELKKPPQEIPQTLLDKPDTSRVQSGRHVDSTRSESPASKGR